MHELGLVDPPGRPNAAPEGAIREGVRRSPRISQGLHPGYDRRESNTARKKQEAIGEFMSREQFWFFHPFRVRYSEIDGQGVVFNAHYLTWFDTTITEYFRALGYDQYADAKKTGIDFHTVKSVVEYKAPILFDWELDVGARVVRIGNSSLVLELAIFAKDGFDALATGEIVWVYTSQQTHRPVPIPPSIRQLIATREHHLA
jgi:acyl-CoA thioester hydrolase